MQKTIAALIGLVVIVAVVYGFLKSYQSHNISQPIIEEKQTSKAPFYNITIEGIKETQIEDTTIIIDSVYKKQQKYSSYLAHYNSNGLQINGLFTVPTGEVPRDGFPAIVFLHGYIPPSSYRTTTRYEEYVDYLAQNGFVVFKIDYRGHGESEGDPGGAYFSADYVLDTLAAVKALQNYDQVNAKAIGIWGHSMSGNVALRTAVVQPEITAVVIWAGAVYSYSDFSTYRLNDNSYVRPPNATQSSRSRQVFDAVGEIDPNNPFWQAMAPTNYLADLTASVQLHHAVDDTVVNIQYSRDLVAKLETAGKLHEFHEYNSGGHNLSGTAFNTAMSRTVDFFSTHLR